MSLLAPKRATPPAAYDGVPIHARGFALAAVYDSSWSPPDDAAWVESEHLMRVWRHRRFAKHVVWKPDAARVVVTQLAATAPRLDTAQELARIALGQGARPTRVVSFPLALRLPLRGPGQLVIASEPHRCRRAWPNVGEPAHLESIDGTVVEFRVTTTTANGGLCIYAEAFVGRAHEDERGTPRSIIYTADARHLLLAPTAHEVESFTAHVMDRLFTFARNRRAQGLEFDHRRLTGRRVGRSRPNEQNDDVQFEIRLPQPSRMLSYLGDWYYGLPA